MTGDFRKRNIEVRYWIEHVTLVGTYYDLVTASIDCAATASIGTSGNGSADPDSHYPLPGSVVYCALRKPPYNEELSDIKKRLRHAGDVRLIQDCSANQETVRQVREYLAGQRRDFGLRLTLCGTAFQQAVWQELLKIPYGITKSYEDIAQAVGSPRGARAVGMANNRNPVSLIVPCHRVIGKNGQLVGYGGGLDIKTRLLNLENKNSGNF